MLWKFQINYRFMYKDTHVYALFSYLFKWKQDFVYEV